MWFEKLMGFAEESPDQVRANIDHQGEFLTSRVNGRKVRCGRLTTPSLAELRQLVGSGEPRPAAEVGEVVGDVGGLHRDPSNAGALFQVASQFNLLEMVGPSVTPEQGVDRYEGDPTQGPACAIVCGGGTIYRNYFASIGDRVGQTANHQIDCLADLGEALGQPGLWEMRNGYAQASTEGLKKINAHLADASDGERDTLRGHLRIGVQHDVEVIDTDHVVTQVYGSALPVAYAHGEPPKHLWEPLARLVLEASYEATILVARQNKNTSLFLTLLGGGAFGNDSAWIEDALLRALSMAGGPDIGIVTRRPLNPAVQRILQSHAGGHSAVS